MKKNNLWMILGFVVIAICLCLKEGIDSDLYWHMATGRWILENLHFPTSDIFSFIYNGQPWVNLTWFFQVSAYLCMTLLDYSGVLFLCTLLYVASTLLTWFSFRSQQKEIPTFLTWLLFCGLFLWLDRRWVTRPEAFTHFFLSLEILILLRFCLNPSKTRNLWWLPLIVIFWINSHSMVILGLVLMGIVFLRFPRQMGLPWLASCLATLITPYGWQGSLYPFYLRKVSADPIYRLIREGQSFWDTGVSWDWYTYWGIWLFLLLFSIRPGRQALGWLYFLWVGFAIYFSTTMVRNLSPSVLITAPFILAGIDNLVRSYTHLWGDKWSKFQIPSVVLSTLLFCSFVVSGHLEKLRDDFQFGWNIAKNKNLDKASDFFKKNHIQDRIFATPEFNNYMMFHSPGFKTYIDTRYAEVVPREHFQKMFQLFLNPVEIEQETQKYQLPVIAINHTLANYHIAVRFFLNSQNWRPVYLDHFMILFFRNNYRPDISVVDLQTFTDVMQQEIRSWSAQNSLFFKNDHSQKQTVYQMLVALMLFNKETSVISSLSSIENKMDTDLKNLYCSILTFSARGLVAENPNKRTWAERAAHICEDVFNQLGDSSSAYNRAAAALILGDLNTAREWVETVIKLNPTSYGNHLLKADILTQQDSLKNFREIVESYKKSLQINPFQHQVWQILIRFQEDRGLLEEAQNDRQRAARFYPKLDEEPKSSR